MMRKSGHMKTWMCVPGRPIGHYGETPDYDSPITTTNHRTVVSYFDGQYHDLDGTTASAYGWGSGGGFFEKYGDHPEPISKSYAYYLLGKSNSFTTFH